MSKMISIFLIIGMLTMLVLLSIGLIQTYGHTRELPRDVDFYTLSNEDIGFITSLITGTNDVFGFALPYPSSVDLSNETIIVHKIQFFYGYTHNPVSGTSNVIQALLVYLSFLKKDFSATFRNILSDTDDEAMKAQFAGPLFFGQNRVTITATAATDGVQRDADAVLDTEYYPEVPLDLVSPLYIQFVNQSASVTLATNAVADATFSVYERVYMRVWFTRRKLSPSEKSARAVASRFALLDS